MIWTAEVEVGHVGIFPHATFHRFFSTHILRQSTAIYSCSLQCRRDGSPTYVGQTASLGLSLFMEALASSLIRVPEFRRHSFPTVSQ